MSDIPTWHERAMAHPDHQSGMISEGMIRARMAEEVADLRAEVKRLHKALHKIAGKVPFADDPWTIARKALEAKP